MDNPINEYMPGSSLLYRTDGSVANEADGLENDGTRRVKLVGSYIRLSTEQKPTAADGVKDGDDLLLVDTKTVHIFYKGTWYQQ